MAGRYKNILLIVMLLALFAPLAQKMFNIPQPSLYGVYESPQPPAFSGESWFDGNWQEHTTRYVETGIGFRPWFIKAKNQLDWWLMKKTTSPVITGKDEYLFEYPYIAAYKGDDFIGRDSVISSVKQFSALTRAGHHAKLLWVFAPSKATYFPERIPQAYQPGIRRLGNYEAITVLLKKEKAGMIDFNAWFLQQKQERQYPLYGRYGIHWTIYGAGLAMDSIAAFLNAKRDAGFARLRQDKMVLSTDAHEPDEDLLRLLNAWHIPTDEQYAYPEYSTAGGGKKPKVLFIGDSYFWPLNESGVLKGMLDPASEFWYYNHDRYTHADGFKQKRGEVMPGDARKAADAFDHIIILQTPPSLVSPGFGFFSNALH